MRELRFLFKIPKTRSEPIICDYTKEIALGNKAKINLTSSGMEIPDYVIDSIARSLLPVIRDYYETEEGRQSFKEWQARREKTEESDSV